MLDRTAPHAAAILTIRMMTVLLGSGEMPVC
jgi:hypothetical protein